MYITVCDMKKKNHNLKIVSFLFFLFFPLTFFTSFAFYSNMCWNRELQDGYGKQKETKETQFFW